MPAAPNAAPVVATGLVNLDLQATQSRSHKDRGIGRWALAYTRALVAARPGLVGAVLMNPDLPLPDGLEGLPVTSQPPAAAVHHVLSPFEPEVTLRRLLPPDRHSRLVVTLYDVIPLAFPRRYLADAGTRRRYHARLELVRAAEAVLAISAATRTDGIELAGLDPRRITVVGTGVDPAFRRQDHAAWPDIAGLEPGYLLTVGGEDERKNLEGLIDAYGRLPAALKESHQLVIACSVTPGYRDHLTARARQGGVAHRLVITGWVADATLIDLYRHARLFAFPSFYEGFGLPIAEAMACGAPAVGSGVGASAELLDPAGQFDPADPADMAATMERALTDPLTNAALQARADRPAPSWAAVAARAIPVYQRLIAAATSRATAATGAAPGTTSGRTRRAG